MRHHHTRPGLAVAVALVVITLVQGDAFAYTLNNLGAAGGWDDINKAPLVTTLIDESDFTQDVAFDSVMNALIAGYSTWDGVAGATNLNFEFKLDDGGNYDVFDGPNDSGGPPWFDGTSGTLDQNASWRYANIVMGGWLPESYFLNLDPVSGSNILAVTWTGRLTGDGSRKPAWHSEIFFNDGWTWGIGCTDFACIDIETVFLHELGHSIGFGHEDTPGVDSVMASFYTGINSVLYQTDIDGAVALYSNPLKGGAKGGGKGGKKNKLGALEADFNGIAVPEPSTLAIFGLGLAVLGLLRRRRAV